MVIDRKIGIFFSAIIIILIFSPLILGEEEHPEKEHTAAILVPDFKEEDIVSLEGNWEFYWEQLLTPADFAEDPPPPSTLIKVPRAWNGLEINDHSIPGQGYATYRIELEVNNERQLWGLRIPSVYSSFKLWANGEQIASSGQVSQDKEDYTPQVFPREVFFSGGEDNMELILQVANFHHARGGFIDNLELGTPEAIMARGNMKRSYDLVVFIGLIVLGLYYVSIFFSRDNKIYLLYFGVFCLLLALRTVLAGEGIFWRINPDFPWSMGQKAGEASYFLGMAAIIMVFRRAFREYIPRVIAALGLVVISLFFLVTVFGPTTFFTAFTFTFNPLVLVLAIVFLRFFFPAFRDRETGASLMFLGLLVGVLALGHDLISWGVSRWDLQFLRYFVFSGELGNAGLLLFAFLQSLGLGRIQFRSIKENEELAGDLQEDNEKLEMQSLEQIKELEHAADKIEQQERQLEKAEQALEKVTFFDPLTGVWNRKYFNETLQDLWENNRKKNTHLAVIFLDIDGFNSFNQAYGYRMGDMLLIKVAALLEELASSPGEMVARYGGEEFVILLPDTSGDRALGLAENIRRKVEGLYLFQDNSRGYTPVTASLGVAALIPDESSIPESLVAQAENAMFQAKSEGKNRVRLGTGNPRGE